MTCSPHPLPTHSPILHELLGKLNSIGSASDGYDALSRARLGGLQSYLTGRLTPVVTHTHIDKEMRYCSTLCIVYTHTH